MVAISALLWLGFAWLDKLNLSNIQDFLSLIPKVVSVDVVLIGLFVKWGWKWRFLQGWLVPFPDLNGTWIGEIHSDWINPETNEKILPIPAMLTVKQSLFTLSCVMLTQEMRSDSYSESFVIDTERQLQKMTYTYSSKPRIHIAERSVPHDGTAVFEIIKGGKVKLKGRYWTERKTTGEITLRFYKKGILEELPKNLGHPLSKN